MKDNQQQPPVQRIEVTVGGRHSKTAVVLLWIFLAFIALCAVAAVFSKPARKPSATQR